MRDLFFIIYWMCQCKWKRWTATSWNPDNSMKRRMATLQLFLLGGSELKVSHRNKKEESQVRSVC